MGGRPFKCRKCKTYATIPGNSKQPPPSDEGALLIRVTSEDELRSVEDIAAHLDLNLADWDVEEIHGKAYQGQQKGEDGQPVVVQMFSGHFRFTPKHPLNFLLTPVQLDLPPTTLPAPVTDAMGLESAIVFSDIHFGFRRLPNGKLDPFHDLDALHILLQIVEELEPELLLCLGDGMDWTEMTTKWMLHPEHDNTSQPALESFARYMAALRAAVPRAEMIYIEGNHDIRLRNNMLSGPSRAITTLNKVGEVYPVVSLEHLADFDSLGMTYIGDYPASRFWINENLVAKHGNKAISTPGTTARNNLGIDNKSVIFGHIHRTECVYHTADGPLHQHVRSSQCFGCLAKIDGTVPGSSEEHNHNQGFGVVDYEVGNGRFASVPILIHEGRAIYSGGEYRGNADEMAEMLGEER
jgi:hypothetical protein